MHQVSDQTQLTIGVELDVVMAKAGHVELDFPGGTVADLAEKCTALMHGTSWKIVNNRSLFIFSPGKATAISELQIQHPGRSCPIIPKSIPGWAKTTVRDGRYG